MKLTIRPPLGGLKGVNTVKYNLGFNIAYALCSAAFYIAFNIKIEGKENLPEDTGFICASNHRTYADPPLVNICIKRKFCFIAKKDLFKRPLFRWLITTLGAVPSTSDDENYNIIEVAKDAMLNQKKCICIFPEGTRHKDGVVGRGHSGVVVMSAQTGAPVVPIAIDFGKKLHFRSKIIFKIGKPLRPEDYGCDENSLPKDLRPMRDDIMASIKGMLGQN